MNKLFTVVLMLGLLTSLVFSQTSMLFYNGEYGDNVTPDDVWNWGFTAVPGPVDEAGYTPGTSALQWSTYDGGGYQGILLWYDNNVDLTSIWSTDTIYFKLRAPEGLSESDTNLNVLLYDNRADSWENCMKYELTNFEDLNDGTWHQFKVALSDLVDHPDVGDNPLDKTNIKAISFEYFDTGVASTILIDKVWVGTPDVSVNWVIFNGQTMSNNQGFSAWGFNNNDLQIAEGEGYFEGTHSILWETSNWDWQGMQFWCETNGDYPVQDFSTSWNKDSLRIKMKAPAGINDFSFSFLDWNEYRATKVLDDVVWDDNWQILNIALKDFAMDEGFDLSTVYWLVVEANDSTISERVLITDIWTGNPTLSVDFVPPPAPSSILVDVNSVDYVNQVAVGNIESESGETYSVYYSEEAITSLDDEGVFLLASGLAEEGIAAHFLYSPLVESEVSFFYAATATDAAGNTSETFYAASSAVTNTARARAVINYGAPAGFAVDGIFDEWTTAGIVPFKINPNLGSPVVSTDGDGIADSMDCSAYCYLAIDNDNLYVAFDVFDDAFTWTEGNTSDWWNDESIEFFIGLYEIDGTVSHHTGWQRGAEPDYRIVFRPDRYTVDAWPNVDSVMAGHENYHFESGGVSDYFIEAVIPLAGLANLSNDSSFTPVQNMKLPIEIQINDADAVNADAVDRIQFGDNSTADAWWNAANIWTFTWIGEDIGSAIVDKNEQPLRFALEDNYPNPFNPTTTIEYSTKYSGKVKIEIFNVLGQNVKTLVNTHQNAGTHKVKFNAADLPSGVYFYNITAKNFSDIKKMLFLK